MKGKAELLNCMMKELELQKDYLSDKTVETIYFGGGTPSLLEADEINLLIAQIDRHFNLIANPEITLEANPDDLGREKIKALKQSPVNRFSIGIQSFFDEDLKWMNRSHVGAEAEDSVKRAQDAGFENITADLIYGFPLLSDEKWRANIQKMIQLQIPHLSCYGMTVEEGTALHHFVKSGKSKQMDDGQGAGQFEILMETSEAAGFLHYEISNFAQPGKESKHNSNYWKGVHYLGVGPSAHSFNGSSRQWNVSNNPKYIEQLLVNEVPATIETLNVEDRFNEYIMTSLRTMWGADVNYIGKEFGSDFKQNLLQKAHVFLDKNWLSIENDHLLLSRQGKMFADHIAAELFEIIHE
jgi:oxygen-independent coproporphyrinogen-3 oxidase